MNHPFWGRIKVAVRSVHLLYVYLLQRVVSVCAYPYYQQIINSRGKIDKVTLKYCSDCPLRLIIQALLWQMAYSNTRASSHEWKLIRRTQLRPWESLDSFASFIWSSCIGDHGHKLTFDVAWNYSLDVHMYGDIQNFFKNICCILANNPAVWKWIDNFSKMSNF